MGKRNNGLFEEESMYEDDSIQEDTPEWIDPSYQYNVEYEEEPEKIYQITLADGTVLSDLRLNGNNFISDKKIDNSTFEYNLDTVIISDGDTETTYHNMALVQIIQMDDGKYWFVLRELSKQEIKDEEVRADIDYLYMMTDVEK